MRRRLSGRAGGNTPPFQLADTRRFFAVGGQHGGDFIQRFYFVAEIADEGRADVVHVLQYLVELIGQRFLKVFFEAFGNGRSKLTHRLRSTEPSPGLSTQVLKRRS